MHHPPLGLLGSGGPRRHLLRGQECLAVHEKPVHVVRTWHSTKGFPVMQRSGVYCHPRTFT